MMFPVYIPLGPWQVHPHALFDVLSYLVGGQVFWWMRRRARGPGVPFEKMMWVLVGMAGGAMLGAKLLAWAESWPVVWAHRDSLLTWLSGKTIAGGLIGGWIGVEVAKRWVGLKQSIGDGVVFAVATGIAVGRFGCYLTGLADNTYGIASSLPWAVDFGDGIPRHPTQLCESLFVTLLMWVLWRMRSEKLPSGTLFRVFVGAYLLFRFGVEFLKPRDFRVAGLSPIQIASLIVAAISVRSFSTLMRTAAMEQAMAPAEEEHARPVH